MKAMILAAGRGERMRPLTDSLPKPLLKVGNHRLIEYHLINLVNAGISDIVINHAWLGEKVQETLGDGSDYGARISYSAETEALETAGGIIHALPMLAEGNDPFLVVNGDVFCRMEYKKLVEYATAVMSENELAHLVLVNNPEHHPEGDFQLLETGLVQDKGETNKTFSGIGLYRPVMFKNYKEGKRALAPVLREYMLQNRVSGEYFTGEWYDIGTPERLAWLNQQLSQQ